MKMAITEMERNAVDKFSTIIVYYASPQSSLVTTEGDPSLFVSFILENPTFVSMIVIDENHLVLNKFGRLFRKEFQMLKTAVFQHQIQRGVPMLSLTVTCTTSILTPSYKNLIGVKCNPHIHWPYGLLKDKILRRMDPRFRKPNGGEGIG